MDKLIEKYPALNEACEDLDTLKRFRRSEAIEIKSMDEIYEYFKDYMHRIGLTPSEYSTCTKWFCDTMEYKI